MSTLRHLSNGAYKTALSEELTASGKTVVEERKPAPKEMCSKAYAQGGLPLLEGKMKKELTYQTLMNHGEIQSPVQDFLQAAC